MWESPINLIMDDMRTELVKRQEEQVLRAVQSVGVDVDKDELIRALAYDRDQYNKGYQDAMAKIVRCKDCDYADYSGTPEGRLYCLNNACHWSDDDYCSKGERK